LPAATLKEFSVAVEAARAADRSPETRHGPRHQASRPAWPRAARSEGGAAPPVARLAA
jgi:hypothetical protein